MITQLPFGNILDHEVTEYCIKNNSGMYVNILNYGAIISKMYVRDKHNDLGDVVLGFDTIDGYTKPGNPYIGSVVGRYANRIGNARFTLDGKEYQLAVNNNGNALHGGLKGFDKAFWNVSTQTDEKNTIRLTYDSQDGEEGYPGNMHVEVLYTLNDGNELKIDYTATTDKATPVNLTNHSYFNLSAGKSKDVLQHRLMINSDKFTAVSKDLIPTGEFVGVKGTVFDFTAEKTIGDHIAEVEGGGYDHNYVLRKKSDELSLAATVYDPVSGRFMEMFTTEPGVQFYSGNFLDQSLTGKGGKKYGKHAGLCLEAQHYPDSPNNPAFPNTILRPDQVYRQITTYKFSVK